MSSFSTALVGGPAPCRVLSRRDVRGRAELARSKRDPLAAGSRPSGLCLCRKSVCGNLLLEPHHACVLLAVEWLLPDVLKSGALQARKPYTITKQREKWSDEEHRMFLEGMKMYGRSWARVATHVQTKSTVQIRSHAQKYFNRLKRVQGAALH